MLDRMSEFGRRGLSADKKGGKKFPPTIPPILPLDKIEKPVRMDTSNKKGVYKMDTVYFYDGVGYMTLDEAEDAVFQSHPYALDDDLPDLYNALIEDVQVVDGMDLLKSEKEG